MEKMHPHLCARKLLMPLLTILLLIQLPGCAFKRITRSKNITYQTANPAKQQDQQQLNIFAPHRHRQLKEVIIFIHGGNWNNGKKSLYNFFGSRMARKDVVMVVIDYPLSPKAGYKDMAMAAATSVQWVQAHIADYGGDPNKIYVSGHSAGGHLAALIGLDDHYFKALGMQTNPIKGLILIDAAGLDMYNYLQAGDYGQDDTYLQTFSKDPKAWKDATPLYHIHPGMPPMLLFQGGRTYPSISRSNEKFVAALHKIDVHPAYYIVKGKKHVAMITQFFNVYNPRYKQILGFMKK